MATLYKTFTDVCFAADSPADRARCGTQGGKLSFYKAEEIKHLTVRFKKQL